MSDMHRVFGSTEEAMGSIRGERDRKAQGGHLGESSGPSHVVFLSLYKPQEYTGR